MNSTQKMNMGIWLDIPYILRVVRKWIVLIVCSVVIVAAVTYVACDCLMEESYSATAILSLMPRQNSSSALYQRSYNDALAIHSSMWNSQVLRREIEQNNPDKEIQGTISAQAVSNTNLIYVTATASSRESAYVLLKEALKYSTEVDEYFDGAYYTITLSRASGTAVSVQRRNIRKYILIAVFLVMLAYCGIIGMYCVFTDVLHNESQANEILAVDLYESLPYFKKGKNGEAQMNLDYLVALDQLTSHIDSHMKAHNQKALMVTSTSVGEGKTTISLALARNLSKRGKKVILVDLDLRKCTIAQKLKLDEIDCLLTEVLEGTIDLKDGISRTDSADNLYVLAAYKEVKQADTVLESFDLNAAIQELADEFEYVIVDTPPLGPVRDAEIIAAAVEAALVVIRQDRIRGSVVNNVCDTLEENGTICIGAVLSQCSSFGLKSLRKDVTMTRYSNYRYSRWKENVTDVEQPL